LFGLISLFFLGLLQVRLGVCRYLYSKEQPLGIAGARFFTGQSPSQQRPNTEGIDVWFVVCCWKQWYIR